MDIKIEEYQPGSIDVLCIRSASYHNLTDIKIEEHQPGMIGNHNRIEAL